MKRRIACLLLAFLMISAFFACAKEDTDNNNASTPDNITADTPVSTGYKARYTEDGRRIITIGTWYDKYYVSKNTSIFDDPSVEPSDGTEEGDRRIAREQMRLDNVREIEKKYNVVIEYVNMTYDGIQESMRTSIQEGAPDVDVYEADIKFAIPAVTRGWAESLEKMGLSGSDIFTEQAVMKYLRLMGYEDTFLFSPTLSGGTNSYVLAFNLELIEEAGLEDPRDLYDRGEWTWDVWREYLKKLTIDRSSQGLPDIYGWSGYWTHLLQNLLFSNNAAIAAGEEEMLSSPGALEVLEFMYSIYNIDKTARPWDSSNWDINNRLYAEGLSGFWVGADWLFSEQGGADLPFEVGVVPWPCGPRGDDSTNTLSTPAGAWYFIPLGVENPRLVYDVMFDWINWYGGDADLGADYTWSRSMYMSERNFDYASMMTARPGLDMWESIGSEFGFNLTDMLDGITEPADIVETFSVQYQQSLDRFFGK
ncbi:MAG: extracellular solute-binding protein [Oscillospiraceae bacterium]|nr:extracellular solute-binding protein [Oscillospiraceae bacterium]